MSLDVYLYEVVIELDPSQCIVCIARGGSSEAYEEDNDHWHRRCVFSKNITHNLGRMANEAGIYDALWHPELLMDVDKAAEIRRLEWVFFTDSKQRASYERAQEIRETLPSPHARDLVPLLEQGLAKMRKEPEYYRTFNAPNGFGTYEPFVDWIQTYLEACRQHPDTVVEVSR